MLSALSIERSVRVGNSWNFYVGDFDSGLWRISRYIKIGNELQFRAETLEFQTESEFHNFFNSLSHENYTSGEVEETVLRKNNSGIWRVENHWDERFERAYESWIQHDVGTGFFHSKGVATDCADAVYGLRWIFARIHKLPMAVTLAGSNNIFTNMNPSSRWSRLPTSEQWYEDRRFMASLEFVMNNTFTGTLKRDLYPAKINSDSINAGAVHLLIRPNGSGHASIFKEVDFGLFPGITILYSDVPRQRRRIYYDIFTHKYVPASMSIDGGIGKFRQATYQSGRVRLKRAYDHEDYSEEQYHRSILGGHQWFFEAVNQRVLGGFDYNRVYQYVLRSLLTRINQRVSIVQEGYEFCSRNSCNPGSMNWENWSTPGRDQRIVDLFNTMSSISNGTAEVQERWRQDGQRRQISIGNNNRIPLNEVSQIFTRNLYSSDPRESVGRRWGMFEF